MKILITGGAGFIGSHVADVYIGQGHKVVVVDNLLTGSKKNVSRRVAFYKADIRDLRGLEKIFNKERPEVINHHAAIAEVAKSLVDPIPTFEVNVLGTVNVAKAFSALRNPGKRKFIFASTGGAIYGEPKKIPAAETTESNPLSPYGLSKKLAEEVIKFYASQHGFGFTILRYANVYGPRQNSKGEAGVVAIFGGLMKRNLQPTIFGDGRKTRDYVYVGDIARANLIALKKGTGETINLGKGIEITDKKIYDSISKFAKFNKPPRYAPHREGEVKRIALDAGKARRVLGWRAKVSLEKGIERTVAAI